MLPCADHGLLLSLCTRRFQFQFQLERIELKPAIHDALANRNPMNMISWQLVNFRSLSPMSLLGRWDPDDSSDSDALQKPLKQPLRRYDMTSGCLVKKI